MEVRKTEVVYMEEMRSIFGHLFKLIIYKPESASKHHPWRGLDLGKLSSFPATPAGLQAIRDFIEETAVRISRDAYKGGWLRVTPHFSRDEEKKGVKCSLLCDCYRHTHRIKGTITRAEAKKLREGFGIYSPIPVDEQRESDFWISKSNLHQVGQDYFVPAWMVDNALEEFRAHSKRGWNCVHRFPAVRAVWPPDMKEAWVKAHLDQLPMEEELLQAVAAREEKQAQQEAEFKRAAVEVEIARAAELQRKEEAAKKELAAKVKKWEKEGRECQKGVSIRFEEWELVSSYKWGWVTKTLHGVNLYFTSTKVDIIHDGACFRKSRRDIEIIPSPIEEVRKTGEQSAPYGLKADGTPRKVAPGPGRPRKFTEEEARHRDAEARALWKELNREKMEEYRRRYREKKKGAEVTKTDKP